MSSLDCLIRYTRNSLEIKHGCLLSYIECDRLGSQISFSSSQGFYLARGLIARSTYETLTQHMGIETHI